MKNQFALCALALISVSACSQHKSAVDLPPGQYQHESTTTDANGTDHTTKSTTTVGYDAYGNKKAVVQKKNSTDPRGLMNKSTDSSTTVIEER